MRDLSTIDVRQSTIAPRRQGFTLVELLVVIGIIGLLAGILFPTISKVRISAQNADSQNYLNQIDQACQAYFTDLKAYPGPLPYSMLNAADQTAAANGGVTIYDAASGANSIDGNQAMLGTSTSPTTFAASTPTMPSTSPQRITGTENLVLGLCGGLAIDRTVTPNRFYYDAAAVGQGAVSFNTLRPGRTTAYMQPAGLSKGQITNDAGTITGVDSVIPEFMDKFATPMPILYLRSRNLGASSSAANETLIINNQSVATNDYNIVEIQPYTSYPTGSGSTLKPSDYVNATFNVTSPHGLQTANPVRSIFKTPNDNKITGVQYQYPYDAYDYLVDPSSYDRTQTTLNASGYAGKRSRKKDSYILISAGKDRIYGTADDITNFGSVLP